MSGARSAILKRVRASLNVTASDPARLAAAQDRIATHPATLVPERALGPSQERVALLRIYLEGQLATVIEVADATGVPAAVAGYLRDKGLPERVRMGGDPRLGAMPWGALEGLDVAHGAAAADDPTGISFALCAIAETGTLVIAAGFDNPVTLAFVPATHVIVVEREAIAGSYEEAIELTRQRFGATGMPRTLNYISGPSRTADIGGKIVIGAHGPRNLCVVIVG